MFLATLATLNFSLAFLVGLLSTPLSFLGQPFPSLSNTDTDRQNPPGRSLAVKILWTVLLQLLSPPVVVFAACRAWGVDVGGMLTEAAFGWGVSGLWSQVVFWCVWWPAWLAGSVVVSPFL